VTQKRKSIEHSSLAPLCPLFGLHAFPHAAEFGKLDKVRHGVAQSRREQGRVDRRLSCLPAAQQRLEPLVPEDRVQLEPVLADDVGAVVAARVGTGHRRPEPRLIERRRKRRRVVVQLLRHLAVEQNFAVLEAACHHVGATMPPATRASHVEAHRTVGARRCVATVGAAATAPRVAAVRRRPGQRSAPAASAPGVRGRPRHPLLGGPTLGRGWRCIPRRRVSGELAHRVSVHDFHGGVAEACGERVLAGVVRHVVGVVAAHHSADCQRRHRDDATRGRHHDARRRCRSSSRRRRHMLGRRLIIGVRPFVLLHVCITNHTTTIIYGHCSR